MDGDESGLELSLGLGCGDSSAKSKDRNGSSSDLRTDDGDKTNKDDMKYFLTVNSLKQDSTSSSQKIEKAKSQENLFTNLSRINVDGNAEPGIGLWDLRANKSSNLHEERIGESGNKRKRPVGDASSVKKHERDSKSDEFNSKKSSFISLTIEDGSVADNEDVADSEVEGSTQSSQHGESSKHAFGFGTPEVNKAVMDLHGQRMIATSSGADAKHGNLNYGVPFPVQPGNYLKPNHSSSQKASGLELFNVIQFMPATNGEHLKGSFSGNPGNSSPAFGYSNVQLPTVDKNPGWVVGRHLQNDNLIVSQGSTQMYPLDQNKRQDRNSNKEEGSSSRHEDDDSKNMVKNPRPKETADHPTTDGVSVDLSGIKPGILADVKFGGSGSCPNLPWVSATGSGPNGRTISGVTYRFNENQIKIVCACHGSHMTPEEFIQHASDENANPENGIASSFSDSPAASAQS